MNCSVSTQTYSKLRLELSDQTAVEIKLAQSDDVAEIITCCPQVSCVSAEASSGRVNYTGRLILTVVYLSCEGKLCRLQKGMEFSHFVDESTLTPSDTVLCKLSCVNIRTRKEGSETVVTVVVNAAMCLFEQTERSVLLSAEGVVCRSEERDFYTCIPFSGESQVEDDFSADGIDDILSDSVNVIVTKCNVSVGEANVEGEMLLTLVGMRGDMPVFLERNIPFKAVVPCGEAKEPSVAYCNMQVNDISVNATVNEDRVKCKIEVVATLGIFGYATQKESMPTVIDAYICGNESILSEEEEHTSVCEEIKVISEQVNGICSTSSKLDYSCVFKAAVEPRVEYNVIEGGIEGVISATLIYIQSGDLHSTAITLPFTVNNRSIATQKENIQITVSGISIRQRAEGECECEAKLLISSAICATQSAKYLTNVECGEERKDLGSAFSVYFAKSGETLWDLSKRISLPPSEVEQLCPDCTYPLSGKERFCVYRMKSN